MAELKVSITDMEPVKSALGAAAEVAKKWEDMRRCYSSTEEADELGDLLDAMSDALAALARKGKR